MPCPALVYLRVNGNKFVPLGKLKKFHQKAPLKRQDAHGIRHFFKPLESYSPAKPFKEKTLAIIP